MRTLVPKSGSRLLDLWEVQEEFGRPVGCVTTTYTFDGPFFEEECLSRFVGMETDATEDVRSYLIEREQRLSEVFAAVLVDRRNVASKRSLRWHQLPVAVPGGILHAKVSLLAWEKHVRVLIGSPNLTKMGYRTNYEQIAVLEFSAQAGTPVELLSDVVAFLRRVVRFLPRNRSGETGPGERADDFLSRVERMARTWPPSALRAGETRAAFLPVLPGGPSLFGQIAAEWRGTGASVAVVTSPFFDEGERAQRVIKGLVSVMGLNGQREITFETAGTRLPSDGSIDLALPTAFREPCLPRVQHNFAYVKPIDDDGNPRALHAKCIRFERGENRIFLVGSSNFTVAGMGIDPNCNIEANLAYVIPAAETRFWRTCEQSVPPSEMIDIDDVEVRFSARADQTTESDPTTVPLPVWFEEALFDPSPEGGRITLTFKEGSRVFSIKDEDGDLLLSSPSVDGLTVIEWRKTKPPSYLIVHWTGQDGKAYDSIWVVNVTDSSKLPPPDELRDLNLEALVEVLTSSRPLYETVVRVLERHASMAAHDRALELDPHRRVDTSTFLLKRVQRVSKALEGLRERLERPVFNLDSLRWRLRGPIGPMALARRLFAEHDLAAPFLIAEVALTLSQVRWRDAEQLLGKEMVRDEVAGVQRELRSMLDSEGVVGAVGRYARDTFREIGL